MSALNIGAHHDSEEVAALKQALANKSNQHATVQSELFKKGGEMEELRRTHNETLQRLQQEAEERFRLGQSVASTAHDLNDERTRRSNLETALRNANERIEERERDLRELQSAVDRLSAQDGTARSTQASVQAENTKLLLRIQELEANNQQLSYAVSTNSKPRPSSGAGDRVVFLEQQLSEVQAKHKRDTAELRATAEKLGRAQADRDHAQNQLSALQRSSSAKEVELRDVLAEKDEELEYLRAQTGGADAHSREDQLLARIEEEETKVQTLELTINRQQDELDAKKGLDRQLQTLQRKVDSAARQVDELSAQLSRSEQQKRSVDARLATVQADAETASSRFSELQRDHRRVVDENSALAKQIEGHEQRNRGMPEHAGHSTTDVQRILISMDRLRTERDELRRQMEFVTLELQCAQEQLSKERNSEVQAGASDERVHALSERCSQHMRSIQRLERSALVLASVAAYTQTDLAARTAEAQHASTRCAELEAHSHDEIQALSAALQAAEAERETMRDDIERLEIELDDERMLVEEAHQAFEETRGELDHTLHSLESVEGQRRHLNLQLYDTKVSINETTEAFKDQADQLANLEKELEDVASERNSLRVHLANLERELDTARHELSEGERRYNDLQAQQLAKMSGDAIAMHLKAQIAELEQRISRRTAEKEVLTHDVKRMETNHRLLEERCSEMTNELDTVIMEKDAMIEDCASTREARDEALRRVEDLEMEVERIESRTSLQQQVSEDQFSAMTVVLAEVAVRSRGITAAWRLGSQRHAATVAQAAESLAAAEQERVSLVQAAATAEDHRQRDFQAINEITAEVHRLREEVYDGTINLRATTLALALSAIDQRKQHLAVLALRHGRVQLVSHLATLELGQKEYQSVLEDLRRELDASELQKHESLASMEALRARHEELEGDVASLQQARDEAELANQQSAAEMTRRFAETATLSAEVEKLSRSNDELELRLEDSAVQHSEAMNALQARLSEATAQTDATRAELARVGDDHRRALEDLELAARRAEAAEANVQTHESRCLEIKGQLEHLRVAHAEQMKATEDSLAAVTARAETAEQAQRTMSAERDSAHAEFTHAREVYERHLAEAQSSLEDAVKVRTELEHAQSYSAQRLEDATSALDLAQAQVNQLADELAAERRLRVASDQENALARTNFETSLQNLEAARAEILSQFEHTRVDLQEKTSSCVRLEEQVTSSRDAAERLRLEVNQLRDMHASLESGVSESEKLAAAYSIELRELQAELQQTKHALQEAESSLLEHIQALEGQQVEAEAKAALDQALHELQEKYDAQLADGKRMANELEENDDRFIALMKERDTHQRKAAALTRKNEKLQTKLDAALAPPPAPAPAPVPSVPSASTSSFAAAYNSTSHVGQVSRTMALAVNATSGPSRPKTPEVKAARPVASPLVDTKTQELAASSSSSSSIGKKRPLPAEFDEYNDLPPQAFTPDSLPVGPPRTRHFPPSARTGTTPSRSHVLAPSSPTRRPPANISDVTNSPRSAARIDGKKSWLSKGRAPNPSSARPAASRRP